ncbi:MAG TPA: hypothetical protein EYO61_00070 [Campylobacterales bacterium]|nr:hypothetical protein [Campylobacterales bacterium]HIO71259.1 hypothetical protein [Campylobacterales bacterium]
MRLVKKIVFYIAIPVIAILFQGCIFFNERGISSRYYSDCHHYYDSRGIYHKKCDENIVDYKDLNPFKNGGNGVYYVEF